MNKNRYFQLFSGTFLLILLCLTTKVSAQDHYNVELARIEKDYQFRLDIWQGQVERYATSIPEPIQAVLAELAYEIKLADYTAGYLSYDRLRYFTVITLSRDKLTDAGRVALQMRGHFEAMHHQKAVEGLLVSEDAKEFLRDIVYHQYGPKIWKSALVRQEMIRILQIMEVLAVQRARIELRRETLLAQLETANSQKHKDKMEQTPAPNVQLLESEQTEIKAIIYDRDSKLALIGDELAQQGDTLDNGTQILQIGSDFVEFKAENRVWTQMIDQKLTI